jgi:hypothetical protein
MGIHCFVLVRKLTVPVLWTVDRGTNFISAIIAGDSTRAKFLFFHISTGVSVTLSRFGEKHQRRECQGVICFCIRYILFTYLMTPLTRIMSDPHKINGVPHTASEALSNSPKAGLIMGVHLATRFDDGFEFPPVILTTRKITLTRNKRVQSR